jgi:hypothetical protein
MPVRGDPARPGPPALARAGRLLVLVVIPSWHVSLEVLAFFGTRIA